MPSEMSIVHCKHEPFTMRLSQHQLVFHNHPIKVQKGLQLLDKPDIKRPPHLHLLRHPSKGGPNMSSLFSRKFVGKVHLLVDLVVHPTASLGLVRVPVRPPLDTLGPIVQESAALRKEMVRAAIGRTRHERKDRLAG